MKKNILMPFGFLMLLSLMLFNANFVKNAEQATSVDIGALNKNAIAGGEYCVGAFLIDCEIYGETFTDYIEYSW